MKHTISLIIIIGLLFSVLPQRALAQPSNFNPDLTMPADIAITGKGHGATDVGKTLMITGASLAMTGLTIFVQGALTYEPPAPNVFDIPMYPIFGVLGAAAGAAVTLVGLPIYCAGSYKMRQNGATHYHFSNDTQRGFAATTELGLGLPNCITFDEVIGYNFNKYVFVGGGMGYKRFLYLVEAIDRTQTAALPIYANARLSLGSKRVSPYVSTSVGYDLTSEGVYTGVEFGTRIRPIKSRDASWWFGTKTEFIGDELSFISLKLGKTF